VSLRENNSAFGGAKDVKSRKDTKPLRKKYCDKILVKVALKKEDITVIASGLHI